MDASPIAPANPRCPACDHPLDLRTRHVLIEGTIIRAYCSATCVARATSPEAPRSIARTPRAQGQLVRILVASSFLIFTSFGDAASELGRTRGPLLALPIAPPGPAAVVLGPSWPPSEQDWQALIAADVWIHPLDGPLRRMPMSDGRVFGAERPGERPAECMNGHCGVDLAGPWGEAVHVAHAGIIDRIQRGPNEDHGGMYVRVAHRDATIFTQYFHLAAIPRRLEVGMHVKAGDLVGLLGDTGVKTSAPHLHFAVSVKPSALTPERYIDPEPLIALWVLRVPLHDPAASSSSQPPPGLPRGARLKGQNLRHPRALLGYSPPPA